MQSIDILRESKIIKTPRVMQLSGMFDIPPMDRAVEKWTVSLPIDEKPWNIGLIVGPSGCGKSTIINELFKENIYNNFNWGSESAIIDYFPKEMGIKDISTILNSVGFSSPPSWFKPYHVLSNGEKFRVMIARALAESKELCVVDEFTSVVDRTVAKIGSSAVAKTVRRMNKKFIAVSCHYDIEEWLQPDWVYKPAENDFQWRLLRRRPEIKLEIVKVHSSAWELFKHHHYLSAELSRSAQCFMATWEDIPVAFHSYLHYPHPVLKKTKRDHRVVCLPDYQGCGIGTKLEDFTAYSLKSLGFDYIIQTAHPVRMAYCSRSKNWKMINKPTISSTKKGGSIAKKMVKNVGRLLASFRYVGPGGNEKEAIKAGYG